GRLIRQEIQTNDSSATHVGSTEVAYDVRNNVTKVAGEFYGYNVKDVYLYSASSGNANAASYTKDNLVSRYKIAGSSTRYVDYSYDSLNRMSEKKLTTDTPVVTTYNYYQSDKYNTAENTTKYKTTLLCREAIDENAFTYYYDNVGNITKIAKSDSADPDNTAQRYRDYVYDLKNQLTREDNKSSGITTTYKYDSIGNITNKIEYAYATPGTSATQVKKQTAFVYGNDEKSGWNNLLTSVKTTVGDTTTTQSITYDNIGNPTKYLGATLKWNGRQLTSYSKSGTNVTYTYDADGLRGTKTVGSTKSKYFYVGGQLKFEVRGNMKFGYFYDALGNLTAIQYHAADGNSYTYYVATNSLGDVISLYSATGEVVANYEYDAWGKVLSVKNASGTNITSATHIANLNPFRYRGYYYDTETKLYYLQSRYYDPEICRFLNADGYVTTGQGLLSHNMFAYCGNNPVVYSDPSGCGFWKSVKTFVSNLCHSVKISVKRIIYRKQALPFKSVSEAAIASGKNLNTYTQESNTEYAQGIVYNETTETYGLTSLVQKGDHATVDFGNILSSDYGNYTLKALVHSHPYCTAHIPNEFSTVIDDGNGNLYGDWVVSSENKIDLYLAAPNGELYLMNWEVGTPNKMWVSSDLPIDNSIFDCEQ
ncbi:MAG: hypothetical protein IKB93_15170, partial [Clostridia bacterium]|nr:hypothetical protein [Clostridia bacterium]